MPKVNLQIRPMNYFTGATNLCSLKGAVTSRLSSQK